MHGRETKEIPVTHNYFDWRTELKRLKNMVQEIFWNEKVEINKLKKSYHIPREIVTEKFLSGF